MNEDETRLREMVTKFRDAIVGKDAARLAALFTDDAAFVNIAAMRWTGREAIASNHAKMFAGPLQITMEVTQIDVRFLREDVALVAVSWKRDVAVNATGPTLPPGSGELTIVATRTAGNWLFALAQNTQAMALPGGPPKS
ncbi:MAG TPA: SgcJ/EcaC family oxidoreductase [Polyangiaceae bacterium]|jgi:uncharacterized protein (TIGR02246 family)|nr:SgcJ/EcaC family oxidoreductase [Polyangiaceae bacterium]